MNKSCANIFFRLSPPWERPPQAGEGGERSELPLTPNVKRIPLTPTLEQDKELTHA